MSQTQEISKNIAFVKECIEKHRAKLLDTTKKNNLISFKHNEKSLQHIRVINELPDFLYGKFTKGKTLTFQALPEEYQSSSDETTPLLLPYIESSKNINKDEENTQDEIKQIEQDLPVWKRQQHLTNTQVTQKNVLDLNYEMPQPTPENQEDAARHTNKFIQTSLKPKEMAKKLSGLNSWFRSDIEESGVNTLYIAFGFLERYDSEKSDKPCVSPLLLLQLEIEKKKSTGGGYTYHVCTIGEEPEVNLSISERLEANFDIQLPEFTEADKPEHYMAKVAELIKNAPTLIPKKDQWRIRRFITIGRFHFARLVMFHDLGEKKWSVSTNKVVQKLFESGDNSDCGYSEDYDIDTEEVEKTVPLLITSADASQHSALVDVMKGKNLAIQGPPGTGKSQTITNIIANALAKGKTVLFLAEKMAALNVVHERLNNANLGSYCLELHSTKAKKAEILKSIEKRLELRTSKRSNRYLVYKLEEFKRYRDCITEYIDALNSTFGQQGKTVYDYLWACYLRKDRMRDCSIFSQIKNPYSYSKASLTENELTAHINDLKIIVSLKAEVNKESDQGRHPWGFIGNFNLNPLQQNDLKQLINHWKEQLEKMQDAVEHFTDRFKLSTKSSASALGLFLNNTETLAHWVIDDLNQGIIANISALEKAEALVAFVEAIHSFRSAQEKICTLKDVPTAITQLKEIEQQTMVAKELKVVTLSAMDIRVEITALEEELKLWEKSLKRLLEMGERFFVSANLVFDNIYILVEVLDYIAFTPRDYLLFKTKDIIAETNTDRLRTAAVSQKHIHAMEMDFDLSLMGLPDEIRSYAAVLKNGKTFSFFNSSYRKAKKFFIQSGKNKPQFNAGKAAKILYEIASTKEEQQKIEQDTQLQTICGSFFNGINTDFEKLYKINEWAGSVRKHYAAGDEFTRNIRQWILTAEMEELDLACDLAKDNKFIALKRKIATIKSTVSPNTPVNEYIDNLKNKAEKLNEAINMLQNIVDLDNITFANIIKDLPHLKKASEAKIAAEKNQHMPAFFGPHYAGIYTDIHSVEQTIRFIKDCLAVTEIHASFAALFNKDFPQGWQNFIADRAAIKKQHEALKEQAEQAQDQSPIHLEAIFYVASWNKVSYSDLIALFTKALDKSDNLSHWVDLNACITKAKQDLKGQLLDIYDKKNLPFETLPQIFEYMIYNAIANEIYACNPVLSSTRGPDLEQARKRIKELDKEILELQQQELCNTLNKDRPLIGIGSGKKSSWTEDPLIHHEISKQKGHIKIRKLLVRAGQSILKIKPCFLMSPLTVAKYLDPEKFIFDLLVIDEASQMRPEYALGGVLRAKQIVVVGDPMQLPPSAAFQSTGKNDEDEEEDFIPEAIMDMAISSFRPSRILSRHYRSRHESLIAFSNYHFYDKRLILFPSPVKNPDELGIKLKYIGGTYAASSNEDEVNAIVKSALNFMKKHPDRSLGIATMNTEQQGKIKIAMERAFSDHPHAAKYEAQWQTTLEAFFVKNLENVQGDERDAIFISTVYGPDKNGTVMQRFGPINHVSGHRRLNVLFTRAKKNMVLFTSLKPEDIKVSSKSSQGVSALKGFLSYASKGVIDAGVETHREPDSDFEIWVKERLESIGCEVHPQVGVSGYRIDLGVKHPQYPYGYLMGVECDGATYHAFKSVRERDVIRQQHLEGLGWRIYRIWSTCWFSNPVKEFEKLKNYIAALLKNAAMKAPKMNNVVIEHDVTPNDTYKEEEDDLSKKKPDVLFEKTTDKRDDTYYENIVQLYDNVTYFITTEDGKKGQRSAQIVPNPSNMHAGTINQHTAIGRALLGCQKKETVECFLPMGKVTLEIIDIIKYKP